MPKPHGQLFILVGFDCHSIPKEFGKLLNFMTNKMKISGSEVANSALLLRPDSNSTGVQTVSALDMVGMSPKSQPEVYASIMHGASSEVSLKQKRRDHASLMTFIRQLTSPIHSETRYDHITLIGHASFTRQSSIEFMSQIGSLTLTPELCKQLKSIVATHLKPGGFVRFQICRSGHTPVMGSDTPLQAMISGDKRLLMGSSAPKGYSIACCQDKLARAIDLEADIPEGDFLRLAAGINSKRNTAVYEKMLAGDDFSPELHAMGKGLPGLGPSSMTIHLPPLLESHDPMSSVSYATPDGGHALTGSSEGESGASASAIEHHTLFKASHSFKGPVDDSDKSSPSPPTKPIP